MHDYMIFSDQGSPANMYVFIDSALASYAVYLAGRLPTPPEYTNKKAYLTSLNEVMVDVETYTRIQTISDCRAAIMREVEGKE